MPTFHFELVSPDKVLFNGSAQAVLVPGAEGDFQVLSEHAPVMTSMRPGVVGIDDAEGKHRRVFVRGGFADVSKDGLILLAETAIPFRPALGGKISHLIGAACVPSFRDNLHVTQDGILGNAFEKRSVAQNVPMLISAQDGSEVEAKSVNVHVHDPVTENTRNELSYDRVIGIKRIAHPGKILVVPALVLLQHIENRVLDAAQADGWSQFIVQLCGSRRCP